MHISSKCRAPSLPVEPFPTDAHWFIASFGWEVFAKGRPGQSQSGKYATDERNHYRASVMDLCMEHFGDAALNVQRRTFFLKHSVGDTLSGRYVGLFNCSPRYYHPHQHRR